MGSYLFVVPPLTGHVNPTVALGAELERRGHQVAWTGYAELIAPLLNPNANLIPIGTGDTAQSAEALAHRGRGLRGAAALDFLWRQFLLPLAEAMVDGVEASVAKFDPDVMIVDQQAFAGAVVARRRGLPWVTSATTSAELVDPFASLPRVGEELHQSLVDLQVRLGMAPAEAAEGDLRFSPDLTVAYTTEALAGPPTLPPGSGPVVMIGPSTVAADSDQSRYMAADFPMEWLEQEGPSILVTLGTVNVEAGSRFFATTLEALAGSGIRAVMVAPPEVLGPLPAEVLARPRIPQLGVLERVDAVVCHGGHNTVCESLAQGLPLVVAPIRDDQPVIADQVARAGAGVRLRFSRCRVGDVSGALEAVLGEAGYREAAVRIQQSFAEAGGAPAAADRIEAVHR